MVKVFLVGNLTRDPELRTISSGATVCSFTVAVNRRKSANQQAEAGQPEADFYRISAWRALGENCSKYLAKGRKVAVSGTLTATLSEREGRNYMNLDVQADDVEFLTPRGEGGDVPARGPVSSGASAPQGGGFVKVEEEDLPF